MKTDCVLLKISRLADIEEYTKLGVSNFLFPLQNFCVGYDEFTMEEIGATGVDAYVLLNRILTDDDIDEFERMSIPSNVLGFVFEDIGLLEVLKGKNYTLITFQNHLNANYETCNFWLDWFDSLVTSTDLTSEELTTIFERSKKPLVLDTFGYPMIMYSRRHLVTNYYEHFGLTGSDRIEITDTKGEVTFKMRETAYGTAIFDTHLRDARSLLDVIPFEKILFFLVDTQDVPKSVIESVIAGEQVEGTTRGFLDKKTVYRIEDLK